MKESLLTYEALILPSTSSTPSLHHSRFMSHPPMRALNFIENNRPGDARSDANRKAVRSWAARDPLLKSGERAKRRRKRYKPPSIVFIDDRAIEALQGTTVPSSSAGPDGDDSSSEGQSASPAQRQTQHIRPYAQDNTASSEASGSRRISLPATEQNHPPQNYYQQRATPSASYPSVSQPPTNNYQPRAPYIEIHRETPSFGLPLSNRPITMYQNFGPPSDSDKSQPSASQPSASRVSFTGYIDPGNTPLLSRPLSRHDPTYTERRNDSIASVSTYASRPDESYSDFTSDQHRTNSLPNPSRPIPIDHRVVPQLPNSVSLPAIRTPQLARRERIQLPPLLPESRASILGTTFSDSPVSAHPKDTSFTAFAAHYRYPTLTQPSHPPMVETVTPMQTPSMTLSTPSRRVSMQSNSTFTPGVSSILGTSSP